MRMYKKIIRIIPIYKKMINIPKKYKMFFWDEPTGKTYVEKYILRILYYGNFEDIKYIFKKYPKETYVIAFRYPEIKRGVKFWIKLWKTKK
jgi:hypothetical protein